MFIDDLDGVARFERVSLELFHIKARLDRDAALPDGRQRMSANRRQSLEWLKDFLDREVLPRYTDRVASVMPALPSDGGDPLEPRPVVPVPKRTMEPLVRVAPPQQQPVAPPPPRRKGYYFS